jgi:hypothetical protein
MFGSFPGLFAAYRVLRRLLAPRHPPYALCSLVLMLALAMEFPRSCPFVGRGDLDWEAPQGNKKPPAGSAPAGTTLATFGRPTQSPLGKSPASSKPSCSTTAYAFYGPPSGVVKRPLRIIRVLPSHILPDPSHRLKGPPERDDPPGIGSLVNPDGWTTKIPTSSPRQLARLAQRPRNNRCRKEGKDGLGRFPAATSNRS